MTSPSVADGDMVEVYHVAAYMRESGFLTEKETGTRHTVSERYRLDGEAAVFVNHGSLTGVYLMKHDVIAEVVAESPDLDVENLVQCLRGIDM